MPVDEVTLAPNLEAVLFTPAVGKRGRHVDAFQTYHDFYKDELHIPQRRFDAGRLPTARLPFPDHRIYSQKPQKVCVSAIETLSEVLYMFHTISHRVWVRVWV